MLSGVLKSKRAVAVNIEIMRAFVQLRGMIASQKQFAGKLSELEQKLEGHDEQIQIIFQAIKELMTPPISNIESKVDCTPNFNHL